MSSAWWSLMMCWCLIPWCQSVSSRLMVVTSLESTPSEDFLEIFDPSDNSWRQVRKKSAESSSDATTDMKTALLAKLSSIATSSDPETLSASMTTRIVEGNAVLQYRLQDGMATRLASLSTAADNLGSATLEFGNTFCIVGGYVDGEASKRVYCWNPLTNAIGENNTGWIRLPDMNVGRYEAAAAVLDSKLYVAGGHDPVTHSQLRDVEVFDDKSQKWYKVADMREPRTSLRLVSLNGRLYALGGWSSHNFLDSAEEYNPQLNLWTRAQKMRLPRAKFGAVVVDDRVFVVGGMNGFRMSNQLDHVEMFTPSVQMWTRLNNCSMQAIRGAVRASIVTLS